MATTHTPEKRIQLESDVVKMLKAGEGVMRIAATLHTSSHFVTAVRRKHNIELQSGIGVQLTAHRREAICKDIRETTLSMRAIARKHKVNHATALIYYHKLVAAGEA